MLLGPNELAVAAEAVAKTATPTSVLAFLRALPNSDRPTAAQLLIAKGVASPVVAAATSTLQDESRVPLTLIKAVATVAAAAFSGYHGARRNRGSLTWGAVWFAAGMIFPVFSSVVALAQGYASPKKD